MTVELVFAIGAVAFAFFSFALVLVISVIREREWASDLPTGLSRRSARHDLQRVEEPKRWDETWFDFVWVRLCRAFAAYMQCKRRMLPGRLDFLIVSLLAGAAVVTWLNIVAAVLEMLLEFLPSGEG